MKKLGYLMKQVKLFTLTILIILFACVFTIILQSVGSAQRVETSVSMALNFKEYPLPENAIELELKFFFPAKEMEEEDIYLWSPLQLFQDSSGNIYVPDQKRHAVMCFDSSGKFIRKIGKQGQGPGDFLTPGDVFVTKDYLVVRDIGNSRFQYLDLEGKYLRSFKFFKTYASFVINENDLVIGALFPRSSYNVRNLIDVLSPEGGLLYSFGEPLIYKDISVTLSNVKLGLNKKGELFVSFNLFPIVRKYSLKGELLAEYRIENKTMNDKEKFNKKMNLIRPKQRVPYYPCIFDIQVVDDAVYLFHYDGVSRFEILEIDKDGKIKNTYYWKTEEYTSREFLVRKNGGEMKFYILNGTQDRIDVLGQKLTRH